MPTPLSEDGGEQKVGMRLVRVGRTITDRGPARFP